MVSFYRFGLKIEKSIFIQFQDKDFVQKSAFGGTPASNFRFPRTVSVHTQVIDVSKNLFTELVLVIVYSFHCCRSFFLIFTARETIEVIATTL